MHFVQHWDRSIPAQPSRFDVSRQVPEGSAVARIGSFSGPSEEYGVPLSIVHPSDNDFGRARWSPELLDPRLHLTDEERQRLQDEIDSVFALEKLTENVY